MRKRLGLTGLGTLGALLLAGCDGGMSSLSDAELRAQAKDCAYMGGSRRIKALTCEEVRKECERRGRYACK